MASGERLALGVEGGDETYPVAKGRKGLLFCWVSSFLREELLLLAALHCPFQPLEIVAFSSIRPEELIRIC